MNGIKGCTIGIKKTNDIYEHVVNMLDGVFSKLSASFLTIIVYKLLLDVMYCFKIGKGYSFFYVEVSVLNIINGWLAVILMSFFIELFCRQNTSSSIILIVLNIIYFIPVTTYCSYGGGSSSFLFFAVLYWFLLSLFQYKIPVFVYKVRSADVTDKAFYVSLILMSVFSFYIWAKYTNFRILTNLFDVYEVRAEAATYDIPQILSYVRSISIIIIPILILLSLEKKKYISFTVLLFLTLIGFSYAGNKSIILFPIILLGGYIFYRKNMIRLIFPMAVILELIGFVESFLGSEYIISLLFRREGLLLVKISECYYRFFAINPKDIFRDGVIGKLGFDSVYHQPISKVIGNNFFTQSNNACNGLLADVWANLGVVGIFIMPLIIIICFRVLDLVTHGVDLRLVVPLILYYTSCFVNSSWSTVLFTHGYLITCLVLMIFPRQKSLGGSL